MRKFILAALAAALSHIGHTQTQALPLLVTNIFGISSSWTGECAAGVIDNRSVVQRQNDYHSVFVTSGSGSWTVAVNYSDVSCSGPWSSFGSTSQISQVTTPPIAFGVGNHSFVQVVITGNAVVTYAGSKNYFLSTTAGAISFPITVGQGGTGSTSLTANGMLFGNGGAAVGATAAGSQFQVFQAGAAGVPTVGAVELGQSAAVTGQLTVPNGGTGVATFSANLPLLGNGTSPVSQGTVTGNTTKFATFNGAATPARCVDTDANGNLQVTGADCSSGGSSLPAASTQLTYLRIKANQGNVTTYEWGPNYAPLGGLLASDYNWPSQSPGGALTAGVPATITLTPCPLGIYANTPGGMTAQITNVYVSGGTGTAEAVPINYGTGTCTSGAATGTINITPANNHSGAWTIQSASGGIQEALNVAPPETLVVIAPATTQTFATIYDNNSHAIHGAGGRLSYINTNFSGTALAITATPPSGVAWCDLDDLFFSSTVTQTSGTFVTLQTCSGFVRNINIAAPYVGMQITNTTQLIVSNIHIGTCVQACLLLTGANGQYTNLNLTAANTATAAIWLQPQFTGATFSNSTFYGGVATVHFDPSVGTKVINETQWNNILIDGAQVECVDFATAAGSSMALHLFRNFHCNSLQYGIVASGNLTRSAFENGYMAVGIGGAGGYYGIGLHGSTAIEVRNNKIQGAGTAYSYGVVVDDTNQNGTGTAPSGITITNNDLGFDQNGLQAGTLATYGLSLSQAITYNNIVATGNRLVGATAALQNSAGASSSNVCTWDNNGLLGSTSITGAATLAFPITQNIVITGSTNITAVSGLFCAGQTGTIIESNAAPPTWTAGATIGNTFNPTQNVPFRYYWDGTKVWLH